MPTIMAPLANITVIADLKSNENTGADRLPCFHVYLTLFALKPTLNQHYKMKRHLLFLGISTLFFCQCTQRATIREEFKNIHSNDLSLYDHALVDSCEKMTIDLPLSSLVESMQITDNGDILYIDRKLCRIQVYDSLGILDTAFFGRGRGPSEIPTGEILGYTPLADGGHVVVGENTYMQFDASYQRTKHETLNLNGGGGHTGDPSDPSIYTMSYDKFNLKSYNEYIYYNTVLANPDHNFTKNVSDFYNQARSLFVTDLKTGNVVAMLGQYPAIYRNGDHNQFFLVNFDVNDRGEIFLSYEASEKIYKYDTDFTPAVSFGLPGRDMRTDYPALTTIEALNNNAPAHRKEYSYYTDLEFMEKTETIARAYIKNSDTSDGLQLYDRNYDLTADLAIPKGYRIGGSHENKLYLYKINESENQNKLNLLILKL